MFERSRWIGWLLFALVASPLVAQATLSPLEGRDINGNPVAANDPNAVFEYDPNLDLT